MVTPSTYPAVKRIEYQGELWLGGEIHPEIARLLAARDCLVTLAYGHTPFTVVLGVPHQSAVGAGQICKQRLDGRGGYLPRDADENAAYYALAAFSGLKDSNLACKLVIMAHATDHDPNKDLDSPYCREIFADQAGLLLECHGSSSARRHDLELSAGKNKLSDPLAFGRRLGTELQYRYRLAVQKEAGRSAAWLVTGHGILTDGKLELPANGTISLTQAGQRGLPALHLEAKPVFRTVPDRPDLITPDGMRLGNSIARTIAKMSLNLP